MVSTPQKYNLSLFDGVTAARPCEFWKAQNGLAFVTFTVTLENQQSNQKTIAILPEGFRPADTISGTCSINENGQFGLLGGSLEIYSSGQITVFSSITNFINASGQAVFYAQN